MLVLYSLVRPSCFFFPTPSTLTNVVYFKLHLRFLGHCRAEPVVVAVPEPARVRGVPGKRESEQKEEEKMINRSHKSASAEVPRQMMTLGVIHL